MKKIVVIGSGGHSRSVCDILLQNTDNDIVGLIDTPKSNGFWGIDVIGDDSSLLDILRDGKATHAFVGLGDNHKRKKIFEYILKLGYKAVNAVSPYAVISPHAHLGNGIALMPGAVIGPNAIIGNGSIINTNASVDHDDRIGDFCHIAPGTAICGTVNIGNEAFIGAGARVIDAVSIGECSIIGAGAAVVSDIPSHCTAVGVPAKVIKYH